MSVTGRFVWYELLTDDPDGAKAFYGEVMGLGTEPWTGDDKPYTIWTRAGAPVGGVMKILPEWERAGVRPYWWAHVAVGDVDGAARRAVELGGAIRTPPTDIPEVGRFAVVSDPQGAVISLFRSNRKPDPPPDDCSEHRFVAWHELNTTDHEAAWPFYAGLFHWRPAGAIDMGEMGSYAMFRHPDDAEDAPVGGMFDACSQTGMPPMWLFYVAVEGIDGALARTRELGGAVLNGPMEVPGGGFAAQCRDPQGALFALFSMTR